MYSLLVNPKMYQFEQNTQAFESEVPNVQYAIFWNMLHLFNNTHEQVLYYEVSCLSLNRV